MLCLHGKTHGIKGISERIKLIFKLSWRGCKRQAIFHILTKIVPMCFLAGLMPPIILFVSAVEVTVFKNRQTVLSAYLIRHTAKFLVVADFVLELKLRALADDQYAKTQYRKDMSREALYTEVDRILK